MTQISQTSCKYRKERGKTRFVHASFLLFYFKIKINGINGFSNSGSFLFGFSQRFIEDGRVLFAMLVLESNSNLL
jgi:hypothetical protein